MHEEKQYNNYQAPDKSSSSVMVAVIAILSVLIIALIIFGTLFFTGTIGPKSAETTDPVSTSTPVNMYVANVKTSIYFRSAPAEAQSNIVCEIPLGTAVSFLENTDAVFAKIMYNGQTGYVKREYLSSTPPAATSSANTKVLYTLYVANVKHSIYLRETPSDNGNIICEIPLGTPVGFIEQANNTFSKINYNGKIGYSKTEYLSGNHPNTSPGEIYLTVSNVKHSIYLRKAPNDNGTIICEIPVGSVVRYISTPNNTFTEIEWNGLFGYSKTEYLR